LIGDDVMFGKRKHTKEQCPFCDRSVDAGQKVCSCGSATRYMDFTERTQYEVQQWRAYQQRGTATA
jgi:hypothetical protein